MAKDLKKRLNQYIEKYQKKGYSVGQIRRALILYGFEPRYVEELIEEYKLKNRIHVMLFLVIVVGLPLLVNPAITGYFMLRDISGLGEYNAGFLKGLAHLALITVLLSLLISAFMASWHIDIKKAHLFNPIDRKLAIQKTKDSISKFLSRLKFKRQKTLPSPEPEEENVNYVLSNPLLALYQFLGVAGILTAAISVFFRNWELMVFSIIGVILAFIGFAKIKKMYYKEVV